MRSAQHASTRAHAFGRSKPRPVISVMWKSTWFCLRFLFLARWHPVPGISLLFPYSHTFCSVFPSACQTPTIERVDFLTLLTCCFNFLLCDDVLPPPFWPDTFSESSLTPSCWAASRKRGGALKRKRGSKCKQVLLDAGTCQSAYGTTQQH